MSKVTVAPSTEGVTPVLAVQSTLSNAQPSGMPSAGSVTVWSVPNSTFSKVFDWSSPSVNASDVDGSVGKLFLKPKTTSAGSESGLVSFRMITLPQL